MNRITKVAVATSLLITAGAASAGATLGGPLGSTLPLGEGGLIGLAAIGVIAGVWLAKRKR